MSATAPESLELQQLADACVQCALCLPHCPTYADSAMETESPRGRILLAKALAAGRIAPREADHGHALSHCLGCRACEAACPAKVEYGRLLHLTRAVLRREAAPPGWQRALEGLLARPRWLAAAMWLAATAQRLPWVGARIPNLPRAPDLPALSPARGECRGRLALVQGCVAAHAERPAHHAALRLLARLGWEVAVIDAGCCGALHRHAGAAETATRLTARLQDAIARSAAQAVVHAGSGCHEAMAAAAGGRPTYELCAFVAADEALGELAFRPSSLRVGLHTACTQRNVVRRPEAERALLARIPGLRLGTPMPAGCCGAAGVQALRFPDQSGQRMSALRRWYVEQQPDLMLAGNLGCRWQLSRHLGARPGTLDIEHPLVFLDRHLT